MIQTYSDSMIMSQIRLRHGEELDEMEATIKAKLEEITKLRAVRETLEKDIEERRAAFILKELKGFFREAIRGE